MDYYIVRIYRRDASNPEKLTGLVEVIGAEKKDRKKIFTNFDELRGILNAPKESSGRKSGSAQSNERKPCT